MPYVKIASYKDISYSSETPENELFSYWTVEEICCRDWLQSKVENMFLLKCRTIGVLFSEGGRHYLSNLDEHRGVISDKLRISMAYLNTEVKPTVVPCTAQLFGHLCLKFGHLVMCARIIQPLCPEMAIKMQKLLNNIKKKHASTGPGHMLMRNYCEDGL